MSLSRTEHKKQLVKRVKRLLTNKSTIDQGVFLQELIDAFGGPRELARKMRAEFDLAPQGGLARQKLFTTIQHLIISTTSLNLTRTVDPSSLSDLDLADSIGAHLEVLEEKETEGSGSDSGGTGDLEPEAEVQEPTGFPDDWRMERGEPRLHRSTNFVAAPDGTIDPITTEHQSPGNFTGSD